MKITTAILLASLICCSSGWAHGPCRSPTSHWVPPVYACRAPFARVGYYAPAPVIYSAPVMYAPPLAPVVYQAPVVYSTPAPVAYASPAYGAPPALQVVVGLPLFSGRQRGGWRHR